MHFELIPKGWLSLLSNVQEMKTVSENTTEKQKNIPRFMHATFNFGC